MNYIQNAFYEATVSLSHGQVTKLARLGPEVHGALDVAEMKEIADLARSNSEVKSAIAELQLPAHAEIVIEPWMYGTLQWPSGSIPRPFPSLYFSL